MMLGTTRAKMRRREALLEELGWDCSGLSISEVWKLWGEVLALLYRDHSSRTIADLIGYSERIVLLDLEEHGIAKRSVGGPNRGAKNFIKKDGRRYTVNEYAALTGRTYHSVYNAHARGTL